jgi:cytochrome P450
MDLATPFKYGPFWRSFRRLFHQTFNQNALVHYLPQETKATRELLYRLSRKPDDFVDHIRL